MKDGKLFGKINIIDLLVLVIALAAVITVGLKLTGRMGGLPGGGEGTAITYTVRVQGVDREVAAAVEEFIEQAKSQGTPGDQLMSNGNLLDGYVTGVTAAPHEAKAVLDAEGSHILIPVLEDTLDLTFTIEGYVDETVKSALGTQEIRVGRSHIVKTTHFELLDGEILSCQWGG